MDTTQLWRCFVIFSVLILNPRKCGCHPEANLSFEERVTLHGYPVETYELTTKDNYILSLYRIPHGITLDQTETAENKSVVFLVHGMGGLPHSFITLGKKESLPYYMADRGFDVWLFCARGTNCSNKIKHRTYNWDVDKKFWDFSWHHLGIYDLTASIDVCLEKTNQSKLFLIGHSAGNTVFFAMASEKPEYNEKIKIAVSYAPSIVMKRMDYVTITFVASLVNILKRLYKILGLVEFFPYLHLLAPVFQTACSDPEYKSICYRGAGVVGSHDSVLMEMDKIMPIIASTIPPRISAQQIFHYLEIIKDGQFQKYDLGEKNNLKIYGQKSPPLYNLSQVTAPTAFFRAAKDSICGKEDVHATMDLLPNVILDYLVPFDKFTHLDFIFAKNASALVFEPTYKLFRDFDNGIIPKKRKKWNG